MKYESYLGEKYGKIYSTFKDEDGCHMIKCNKGGKIGVWSLNTDPIELYYIRDYGSKQKKTWGKKTYPEYVTIKQEGSTELVCSFPETRISEVEDVFSIRKRNQISDAVREQMSQRMKNIRGEYNAKRFF